MVVKMSLLKADSLETRLVLGANAGENAMAEVARRAEVIVKRENFIFIIYGGRGG